MKQYKLLNNVLGWVVFAVAAITYILTLEPTASFWDCGEFIASGYKLEVGHPPGNPIFMLTARFFANFASSPSEVAYMVNLMSGLLSAATILLLFWTITRLAQKVVLRNGETTQTMSLGQMITILGCGLVGSLAYAWSDTFWFSAVEGEVYAYSSFCTALVFWLILKWESIADEPHANRYIILIAYIIGVSIAVHLLNLLCIPAIVLVYYYRKYKNTNLKGSLIALLLSFLLIVLLLYGLVPGFVKVAGWFELFFVNTLHMPYNSGVIFYFLLIIGVITWAIYETYAHKSDKRIKISFFTSVVLVGIPFIGDGYTIGILLTLALGIYLYINKKTPIVTFNTILLSLFVIFVGYSSYALILIRSTANTPMDQNSPEDIFSLASYLNREQYGDRPLLYGQTFAADVVRDANGSAVTKEGKTLWGKKVKTQEGERDQYVEIGRKFQYVYQPELCMLFPRMHSQNGNHINAYKEWSNFKGRDVRVNGRIYKKPTITENLRFFFDYQLNYMYWRYFLWNFAGRQNDIQGHGEVQNGNWISGFNFIDKHIAGDQTNLPKSMKDNPGRNVFYLLPLLLGIIGLLYQAFEGKKGIESFWVTFFLFFMTGIAIVIYLNQTPYQPRERDYAYAGSFYAFTIWIGLGVAAIYRGLTHLLNKTNDDKKNTAIAALTSLLCLCVPLQMVSQTWDDHDRSGRYIARDFGMNYLSSVDENGIIFTNGDNDTFPLWYAQEVEGYRTDVRVCNLSYLQTDWYIDQMKRPAYESAPLPISPEPITYHHNKRDYAYLIPQNTSDITLTDALNWLYSDEKHTKQTEYYHGNINHMPTNRDNSLFIPIDSAAVAESGIIPAEWNDAIVDRITPKWGEKSGLYMTNVASLDIINTNAQQGWKRPIYFAMTVGSDSYLGLEEYFSQTGLAYQVVPLSNHNGGVNTEKMYDNIVNKFRWGGLDQSTPDKPLYLDENTRRMCTTLRMAVAELATQLIEEGKTEKALTVLDLLSEKMPSWQVPHDLSSFDIARAYLELSETEKGEAILKEVFDNTREWVLWEQGLTPQQFRSAGSDYVRQMYIAENAFLISYIYELPQLNNESYQLLNNILDYSLWNIQHKVNTRTHYEIVVRIYAMVAQRYGITDMENKILKVIPNINELIG